ncbi:hypothetical protein ScPMuIL_009450 [Solemya velum]
MTLFILSIFSHGERVDWNYCVSMQQEDSKVQEQTTGNFISGSDNCGGLCDMGISTAYNQLNYSNSIRRFLLSQVRSIPSDNEVMRASPQNDAADICNSDVQFNLNFPKPPSSGSSTKVLVSEKGAHGDANKRKCHGQELQGSDQIPSTANDTPDTKTSKLFPVLTQTALSQHTKLQEKLYIKQAKKEIEMLLKGRSKKHKHLKLQTKHSIFKDVCGKQLYTLLQKREKPAQNNSVLLKSSKSGSQLTSFHQDGSKHTMSCHMEARAASNSMGSLRSSCKIPHSEWKSPKSSFKDICFKSKGSKHSTYMPWFFYPQKGLTFMPQVMRGFCKPERKHDDHKHRKHRCSRNPPRDTASDNPCLSVSTGVGFPLPRRKKEDRTATSPHPIQSGSQPLPPWLLGTKWNQDIQTQYQLPTRKMNRVLKEDRNLLQNIRQSTAVSSQIQMLFMIMKNPKMERPLNQSADYLFYDTGDAMGTYSEYINQGCLEKYKSNAEDTGDALRKLSTDGRSDVQSSFTCNSSVLSPKEFIKTIDKCSDSGSFITLQRRPTSSSHGSGNFFSRDTHKSVTRELVLFSNTSPDISRQSNAMQCLENESISHSLENANVSSGSCSNDSSIPSDQHTAGEIGSSYKESEASSKESTESSKLDIYPFDEQKMKVNNLYEKLFVKFPIGFANNGT